MTDKNYCMSSYLAFRYIEKDGVDFADGLYHKNVVLPDKNTQIPVRTADDIDREIAKQFGKLKNRRKGILLSGGMDSAIVASFMPGCDAYTFRFLDGAFQKEELKRAEMFAEYYHLTLHYVDINWNTVEKYLPDLMRRKAAPVHSIEPQIFQAAEQAKTDGVDIMLIGESSDLIFGGMDQLLSRDWNLDAFMNRYIFVNPEDALRNPVSMKYVFERYRRANNKIDFLRFMDDIFSVESSGSYFNAFETAVMDYYDPYVCLKMAEPLDLKRVRNGESKYLIRELFAKKYPGFAIPEKNPMPRPVDVYFADWKGPEREEFRRDIEIKEYSGNQKWLIWCLERFLNLLDEDKKSTEISRGGGVIIGNYLFLSILIVKSIRLDGHDRQIL